MKYEALTDDSRQNRLAKILPLSPQQVVPNAIHFLSGTARTVRQSQGKHKEFPGRLTPIRKEIRPQMALK